MAGDRWVRSAAVAAGVLLAVLGVPGGARADGGPGSDSRYYVTELTAVRPATAGLRVDVTRSGEWVRVTNTTATPLTVLGYTDEPYLRLSPAGTEENRSSLSTYLNDSLVISQVPPDWTVKPVQWTRVSATPAYSWHDHRVHWMTSTRPPIVAKDPEHPHLVSNWTIRMLYGDAPVTVTGTLSWSGRPSQFGSVVSRVVWAVAVVALLVVAWRLGLGGRSRRSRRAQDRMAPAA